MSKSKSNHQKHGCVIVTKKFRRCKNFVGVKAWIRMTRIHDKWNGTKTIITPEIGIIENIRLVEINE